MSDRERRQGGPPKPADFDEDLDPKLKGRERQGLLSLAARLREERPVPRPGFRSAMRSRLLGGGSTASPSRVPALIFGYAASGALLLAVAAVGLAGIGPFAA